MGDVGDMFNEMRNERREKRRKYGMPCPTCTVNLPKAQPTILLPHQRCRVCGYVDKRARGKAPKWTAEQVSQVNDDTDKLTEW